MLCCSVRPPKKSWKKIFNLSGGEKTLSSLALVFALHHYKPTPLYFMDEIDAALDFKNVSIVALYIYVSSLVLGGASSSSSRRDKVTHSQPDGRSGLLPLEHTDLPQNHQLLAEYTTSAGADASKLVISQGSLDLHFHVIPISVFDLYRN